jgi:glycosyltransferase involved in cell wall biosynthesis
MRQSDVAVVVPVYNRATTVLETLSSVANQTTPPRQLIIVDDGSLDDSAATVSRWIAAGQFSWKASLIRQTNQGAGAARNRGFAAIDDARYVAFLDSDDRWPADFLIRAVARLEANDRAVAATADRLFHREHKKRPGFHTSRSIERNPSSWLMTHSAGIASCTLFRADAIRRLGGFDPTIATGQDTELFLRLSKTGQWLHVPGEPVRFYVGFSALKGEESNLSFKYADRKHRWVQIRERFIFCQAGHEVVPRQVYRQALAKMWHKAGRDYHAQGHLELAADCFRKAAAYRPFMVANWWLRALDGLHASRNQ